MSDKPHSISHLNFKKVYGQIRPINEDCRMRLRFECLNIFQFEYNSSISQAMLSPFSCPIHLHCWSHLLTRAENPGHVSKETGEKKKQCDDPLKLNTRPFGSCMTFKGKTYTKSVRYLPKLTLDPYQSINIGYLSILRLLNIYGHNHIGSIMSIMS